MTTRQGWDRADFRCGRCGFTFSVESEAAYARLVPAHQRVCTGPSRIGFGPQPDLWAAAAAYLSQRQQEEA